MSGTLGNLSVILTLDNSGFTLGMAASSRSAQQINLNITNITNNISNMNRQMKAAQSSWALWAVGIGEVGHALEGVGEHLIDLVEKLIETNSEIQKTTLLLKGLSTAATSSGQTQDANNQFKSILDMADRSKVTTTADHAQAIIADSVRDSHLGRIFQPGR